MNLLKSIFTVDKKEIPYCLGMFFYFFLTIATFWILKPLKKTYFISYYDQLGLDVFGHTLNAAQVELLAKSLNLVVAIAALAVFSKLSQTLKKEKLTYVFSTFFLVCFAILGFLLNGKSEFTIWFFYLLGDLFITLMVTTFFASLSDSVSIEASKRMYGPIVLGGVLGGVVGTTWVRVWIKMLPPSTWMWICFFMVSFIIAFAKFASSNAPKKVDNINSPSVKKDDIKESLNLKEFLLTVSKNKYIISIILILGLYEAISTVMDFQFSSTVSHLLDGKDIGSHFSTVYAIVSWLSLFVQLFVTSFVMTQFGVKSALLVLPTSIFLATFSFVFFPLLWIASLLPIFDNALNYSIHQSAREALYVPLKNEERYQAKAFIDIFIMRGAKVCAIGVSLIVSIIFSGFDSLRWLSLLTAILILAWIFCINYAGNKYKEYQNR